MPAVVDTEERRAWAATATAPPGRCPDDLCGSTDLVWELGTRLSHHAPGHGQLRMDDVVPRVVLVCQDCAEPLWFIESDEELAEHVVAPRAPIQIIVNRKAS